MRILFKSVCLDFHGICTKPHSLCFCFSCSRQFLKLYSLFLGILRVGQEIEVRPGIVSKSGDGKVQCRPIFSKIVSLFAEQNHLEYAVPGGIAFTSFEANFAIVRDSCPFRTYRCWHEDRSHVMPW